MKNSAGLLVDLKKPHGFKKCIEPFFILPEKVQKPGASLPKRIAALLNPITGIKKCSGSFLKSNEMLLKSGELLLNSYVHFRRSAEYLLKADENLLKSGELLPKPVGGVLSPSYLQICSTGNPHNLIETTHNRTIFSITN
jgi:hypothetical protein